MKNENKFCELSKYEQFSELKNQLTKNTFSGNTYQVVLNEIKEIENIIPEHVIKKACELSGLKVGFDREEMYYQKESVSIHDSFLLGYLFSENQNE